MTKDQISSFTFRITESNPTELICILYEIFFSYLEDASAALEQRAFKQDEDWAEEYGKALRGASKVIRHLEDDLDFKYEISAQLYSLYQYVLLNLAKASYRLEKEDIENSLKVMKPLYESFREVAAQDDSAPVMKNAQSVSAGYTYGRNDVTEAMTGSSNRGFLA